MKHSKVAKNNRVYRYRLYPTKEQEHIFAQYFGVTRWVWNWALAERERVYEEKKAWTKEQKEARQLQYDINKALQKELKALKDKEKELTPEQQEAHSLQHEEECKLIKEKLVYFDDDLSAFSQTVNFTHIKNTEEFQWLKDIDSHVPAFVINHLDEAFKHAYRRFKEGKRGRAIGWPRFKKKTVFGIKSFTTRGIALLPDTKKIISGTATVTCRALRIPRIGKVWINLDREPIGTLARVTIKKEKSGKYTAIILATTPIEDSPEKEPKSIDPEKVVGLNCGLRRLATLHNGEFIPNPEYYGKEIKRLRFLQRKVSRLERYRAHDKNGKPIEKPSKALIKAQLRYNKAMEKVVDKRERYAHSISKRIVNDFDVIALETWSPAKLIRHNTKALSFRIADAGWGKLRQQLEYKAKRMGKIVIKLDEFEPLTKVHHKCGKSLKVNYSSSSVKCHFCNEMVDIDINAAINGRTRALETLSN